MRIKTSLPLEYNCELRGNSSTSAADITIKSFISELNTLLHSSTRCDGAIQEWSQIKVLHNGQHVPVPLAALTYGTELSVKGYEVIVAHLVKSTESNVQDVPEHIHQQGLVRALRLVALSSQIIDAYKRAIFYGDTSFNVEQRSQQIIDQISDIIHAERYPLDCTIDLKNLGIRGLHACLGSITECGGEIAEALIKGLQGDQFDMVNILEELSDGASYYTPLLLDAHDRQLSNDLTFKQFMKLLKRFPDGFTANNALNRDTAAERKILEG